MSSAAAVASPELSDDDEETPLALSSTEFLHAIKTLKVIFKSIFRELHAIAVQRSPDGLPLAKKNVAIGLMSKPSPQSQPSPPVQLDFALSLNSPSVLEKGLKATYKLVDRHLGFLGSYVMVHPSIGITAFHTVLYNNEILQDTLYVVAGNRIYEDLIHLASHPFYDLSFFLVRGAAEEPFLTISKIPPQVGDRFFVSGFPDVDPLSSSEEGDLESVEDAIVTPGSIVRLCASRKTPFAAGEYQCCRGTSGGAAISRKGKLIGMHVGNLYATNNDFLKTPPESAYYEDFRVLYPDLEVRPNIPVEEADMEKLLTETTGKTLAKHAVSNIGEKSAFGCFLPSLVISLKLDSVLARMARVD